jgi:hypothetical protein
MTKYIILLLAANLSLPLLSSSKEPPVSQSQGEISLDKDREELNELRKDIPEDIKKENDDLAFILNLFNDPKRDPNKIRREFDKTISNNRKKKEREFKVKRQEFTAKERQSRKDFVSQASKKRNDFLKSKKEKEEKKDFFDRERDERKIYFANEKEKRNVFESEMRSNKKDFDDFLRDKRKEFDDHLRAFKKEQDEIKRKEKLEKEQNHKSTSFNPSKQPLSPENQSYLEDFKKIPDETAAKLEPKGEE